MSVGSSGIVCSHTRMHVQKARAGSARTISGTLMILALRNDFALVWQTNTNFIQRKHVETCFVSYDSLFFVREIGSCGRVLLNDVILSQTAEQYSTINGILHLFIPANCPAMPEKSIRANVLCLIWSKSFIILAEPYMPTTSFRLIIWLRFWCLRIWHSLVLFVRTKRLFHRSCWHLALEKSSAHSFATTTATLLCVVMCRRKRKPSFSFQRSTTEVRWTIESPVSHYKSSIIMITKLGSTRWTRWSSGIHVNGLPIDGPWSCSITLLISQPSPVSSYSMTSRSKRRQTNVATS